MITITPKDLWQLELTDFFVSRYGYQMLRVQEDRENTWLINTSNSRYPIVYITKEEVGNSVKNAAMRDEIHLQILAQVHSSGGRLEICVGGIGAPEDFEEGKRIGLMPGNGAPKDVLEIFPDLDKALEGVTGQNLQRRYLAAHQKLQNDSRENMFPPVYSVLNPKGKAKSRKPYAIYSMMGICFTMFAVSWLLRQRFYGTYDASTVAVFLGAYYKAFILGLGEWWRLLTSVFLHIELLHVISNLLALYLVGSFVERAYGHWAAAVLVVLSGIAGNAFYLAAGQNTVSCGISGGVYGLLGALMIYYLHTGLWKIPRIRNSFLMMLALNIFISFMPGISWMAHLGGFLMGTLVAFLLTDHPKWKNMRPHMLIAGVILWGGIVYLCMKSGIDKIYFGTDQAVASMADTMGLKDYAARILKVITEYYHSIGF